MSANYLFRFRFRTIIAHTSFTTLCSSFLLNDQVMTKSAYWWPLSPDLYACEWLWMVTYKSGPITTIKREMLYTSSKLNRYILTSHCPLVVWSKGVGHISGCIGGFTNSLIPQNNYFSTKFPHFVSSKC